MLDDFTETNGSTLVLPGSHVDPTTPSDEFFHANAVQTLGKRGDVLLFNGNLFHASGLNKSSTGRRALPITFTKSFYKQLMDYPRALGYNKMNEFSEPLQQILGYLLVYLLILMSGIKREINVFIEKIRISLMLSNEEGNNLIANYIEENKVFAVSRLGIGECGIVYNRFKSGSFSERDM